MRNILKTLTQKPLAIFAAAVVASTMLASPIAAAYTGTYTGSGKPQFNIYNDVSGVGNESDFLRIGAKGAAQDKFTNQREVCNGEADLWVYIHNGAPKEYNEAAYNASGVATDTKLRVQLPTTAAKNNTLTGTISASNASSVSDTTKLTCGSHDVDVEYVAGSAVAWSEKGGTMKLSDSVVNGGATIGTENLNGKVPGCWEYRIWVKLTVKVEKKEQPQPKPSTGICKVTDVQIVSGRTVKTTVNAEVENATVVGYEIDFGDGTKVKKQTAEHTYAKDGTYTITGRVQIKLANGDVIWKTADNCTKKVTFEAEQPTKVTPEVPPTMPKTGAAGLVALFSGVTAAGAVGHRLFTTRRFNK